METPAEHISYFTADTFVFDSYSLISEQPGAIVLDHITSPRPGLRKLTRECWVKTPRPNCQSGLNRSKLAWEVAVTWS